MSVGGVRKIAKKAGIELTAGIAARGCNHRVPSEKRAAIESDLVATSVGPGYGMILDSPDAVVERLNEEHGIIDLSRCRPKPALGEQVAIVPNHVCVVSNLNDEVVLSRDGRVVDTWRVVARGKTR